MADRPLRRIHAPRAIRDQRNPAGHIHVQHQSAQPGASTSGPQPPALSSLRDSAVNRWRTSWFSIGQRRTREAMTARPRFWTIPYPLSPSFHHSFIPTRRSGATAAAP